MIGLMDCNNFFASCERLFRPDLLGKPVTVLSSNDGCFIARTQEVKDLGIPMGAPYFEFKDVVEKHGVHVFSSNFALYRDMSRRVMEALEEEFEVVEVYSIDEAFVQIPSYMKEEEIVAIRKRIIQKTGIPVSIGLSQTKTIAKIANNYAKKGTGTYTLDAKKLVGMAAEIPCGSIWGIGRRMTAKLNQFKIYTLADLLSKDRGFLKNTFGVVGERLYLELTGTSVSAPGEQPPSEHESIASTRSFAKETKELSVLESALGYHVAHVGEKLRERNMIATRLSILALPNRFGDFFLKKGRAQSVLVTGTDDTAVLLKEALRLLREIYDSEVPYKKAGIVVSGILPKSLASRSLFEKDGSGIYTVLDQLNERFGGGTIRPGVVQETHKWESSKRLKSKEYTTKWNEIAVVKAI